MANKGQVTFSPLNYSTTADFDEDWTLEILDLREHRYRKLQRSVTYNTIRTMNISTSKTDSYSPLMMITSVSSLVYLFSVQKEHDNENDD